MFNTFPSVSLSFLTFFITGAHYSKKEGEMEEWDKGVREEKRKRRERKREREGERGKEENGGGD